MKKPILLLVVLVLVLGCKRDPLPSDAIPRDQFVDILVDVHIAEAMTKEQFRLKFDTIYSTSMYMAVLEKYQVTKDEMLTTSLYYSRHQREYKKIYTDVLDKISIMLEEENAKQELNVKSDSINPRQIKSVKSIVK